MKVATTCWEQLLVILYVVLRHAAKISRRFLPDFFQFCRRQKGDQKWRPKLGSVKLNFPFGGTVLGSTFGPCFQFPQVSQKCANCWTRPTKFWRQERSQARSQGPQWQVIIQDLFLKIWDAVLNKVTAAYQRHAAMMESNAGTILVHTVRAHPCEAIFARKKGRRFWDLESR